MVSSFLVKDDEMIKPNSKAQFFLKQSIMIAGHHSFTGKRRMV